MIKVAVTGAAGRMGSGIIRKITQQDDMEVVAAIEIPNSPLAGVDAGIQAGAGELGVKIVGAEKHILKTRDKLNNILSAQTGQPLEKIEQDTERDNFMSAEEAVAYGLVDQVVVRPVDISADNK